VGSGSCADSLELAIVINPGPSADAGTDQIVCGLHAMLDATDIGTWNAPVPGTTVNPVADPTATATTALAGTYPFIWTVGTPNCSASDTVLITFHLGIDSLWVDAGEDRPESVFTSANLHGSAAPGTVVQWTSSTNGVTFDDPFSAQTLVTGLGVGANILVLTATDGPCASVSDTVIIHVQDLVIPQGFSPNGDGVNDLFAIPGIRSFENAELEIFNRWGQMVYQRLRWQRAQRATPAGRHLFLCAEP
jgi:hypothetical protein